jgi:hypothetical protein
MPLTILETRIRPLCVAVGLAVAATAPGAATAVQPVVTNRPLPKASPETSKTGMSQPGKSIIATAEGPLPNSPRESYNAGTEQLRAGKFREAEANLESALASQQEKLQEPALYNLGHVRFNQGIEVLKKSPPAGPTMARGRAAEKGADDAMRKMDTALGGNDVQKLVAAYMHGRGARKELRAAIEAVRRAITAHGAALARWQRSSGDFKSVLELRGKDGDSEHNAEVVDRWIAKLVDSLREMQACASGMCDKNGQMGSKMKQLKGRIPGKDMPPGAGDDDEEDEDQPFGKQLGQEEGPSTEGKEMTLSQEQAGWVLEGFKLDKERRLPMGQGEEARPKDKNRPTW